MSIASTPGIELSSITRCVLQTCGCCAMQPLPTLWPLITSDESVVKPPVRWASGGDDIEHRLMLGQTRRGSGRRTRSARMTPSMRSRRWCRWRSRRTSTCCSSAATCSTTTNPLARPCARDEPRPELEPELSPSPSLESSLSRETTGTAFLCCFACQVAIADLWPRITSRRPLARPSCLIGSLLDNGWTGNS